MSGSPSQRFWRQPLDAATLPRISGTVHIQEERCKGCAYCVEFCPCGVLELSDRFNLKGYHPPDIVDGEACLACRLCELLCPEFAIAIEEHNGSEVGHAR